MNMFVETRLTQEHFKLINLWNNIGILNATLFLSVLLIRVFYIWVFACQMQFFFITLSYSMAKAIKVRWTIFEIAYVLQIVILPSIKKSLKLYRIQRFFVLFSHYSIKYIPKDFTSFICITSYRAPH